MCAEIIVVFGSTFRCFARDLSPLSGHPGLQELHLAYDCWSVMHLCLPDSLPVLKRMRIMSAIQDIGPLARFTGLQVGGCCRGLSQSGFVGFSLVNCGWRMYLRFCRGDATLERPASDKS